MGSFFRQRNYDQSSFIKNNKRDCHADLADDIRGSQKSTKDKGASDHKTTIFFEGFETDDVKVHEKKEPNGEFKDNSKGEDEAENKREIELHLKHQKDIGLLKNVDEITKSVGHDDVITERSA